MHGLLKGWRTTRSYLRNTFRLEDGGTEIPPWHLHLAAIRRLLQQRRFVPLLMHKHPASTQNAACHVASHTDVAVVATTGGGSPVEMWWAVRCRGDGLWLVLRGWAAQRNYPGVFADSRRTIPSRYFRGAVSTASGVGTPFVQTKWNLKHLMQYSLEVRGKCETITNIEITNLGINFTRQDLRRHASNEMTQNLKQQTNFDIMLLRKYKQFWKHQVH